MATDAELLDLANQAQGLPPEPPPPLARQVPPGTPGAVEGPVYKDPAAAPLVDPAIAAQTPGLAEPPAPVAPVTAVPPPAPSPAPVAAGKPSIQNAANAADIATQAGFDTAAAQGEVAKAKAGEREGNAAAQDKVAALERAHADEIAQQQATQKAAFDQANAVASKAEDEYGKSANGLHDLMQNKADAQLAKARIFIAVGAAANALVGGGNPALEKLKLTIDNDFRIQQSKLRSQEHFASMKRAGVASVSSQFAHDTALLGLKQAAAYQAAATEAKAEAIRRGASPEEAENNVAVLALKQKALELNAANREKLQQSLASQMMAGAHLALARQTAEVKKTAAADKANDAADATEVINSDSQPMGHAANSRTGQSAAAEARKRVGVSNALIGAIEDLKADVARSGNNVIPFTEDYTIRQQRIANVQAKKRVADELPASEGGMHLEKMEVGGEGTLISRAASPKNMDNLIHDIKRQVDTKNGSIITSKSREAGAAKPASSGKHAPGDRVVVKGTVYTVGADGDTLEP